MGTYSNIYANIFLDQIEMQIMQIICFQLLNKIF